MNNNFDSSSCIITYPYTTKKLTKEIIEEHFDGKGNLIKRVIINEYEDNLW